MQDQSYSREETLVDEVIVTNTLVSPDPIISQDASLRKSLPYI